MCALCLHWACCGLAVTCELYKTEAGVRGAATPAVAGGGGDGGGGGSAGSFSTNPDILALPAPEDGT